MPVKIFVGNVAPGTDRSQLRKLFEQHGAVIECAIVGCDYGFVHMESKEIAGAAVKALSGFNLNGNRLSVEISTPNKQGRAKLAAARASTMKIFVGNLSKSTTSDSLRRLFAAHGGVSEADVLSGFGFVHMYEEQEALKAIKTLDGYVLDGSRIHVELSTDGTRVKSKEREVDGGRGIPTLPRSCAAADAAARNEPCPPPPIASAVETCETRAYASRSPPPPSTSVCVVPSDTFARDLLALYHRDRAAFDAYANDPMIRRSLNLPPV